MSAPPHNNRLGVAEMRQCMARLTPPTSLSLPNGCKSGVMKGGLTYEPCTVIKGGNVHSFNGKALCPGSSACDIPPGVTFGVLLVGSLEFMLDKTTYQINTNKGAILFCYCVKEGVKFRRLFNPDTLIHKVIVTTPLTLLDNTEGSPTTAEIFSHGILHQRPANTKLIDTALALEALSIKAIEADCSTQTNLLRDAKAIELTAIALDHLLSACSQPLTREPMQERIRQQVDKYLVQQESAIGVKELALKLNMSLSKLQRVFRNTYDKTVYEYAREQRLRKAKLALELGGVSIGEAAYLAGFKHTSNFSLAYKKQFGITPGSTAIKA